MELESLATTEFNAHQIFVQAELVTTVTYSIDNSTTEKTAVLLAKGARVNFESWQDTHLFLRQSWLKIVHCIGRANFTVVNSSLRASCSIWYLYSRMSTQTSQATFEKHFRKIPFIQKKNTLCAHFSHDDRHTSASHHCWAVLIHYGYQLYTKATPMPHLHGRHKTWCIFR